MIESIREMGGEWENSLGLGAFLEESEICMNGEFSPINWLVAVAHLIMSWNHHLSEVLVRKWKSDSRPLWQRKGSIFLRTVIVCVCVCVCVCGGIKGSKIDIQPLTSGPPLQKREPKPSFRMEEEDGEEEF